ncbi:hypothetical protein AGDE_14736 [Angomonas deanei]|uniref:4'-phosphopantetheinyl transferase superfamily n=1 Tax=Angomonas deanei TaxID=59799 RepID=A0A7G2CBB5_9TRYP|nr:hypothetical protein AGDE_14736 [Angomonas deanei]CAD2216371.1 hypothetical protein, conserved [Angomonas deanei]|eukprot:EPY20324.1 hypothetical protein AGDE_14736 [Angomonas deanei]
MLSRLAASACIQMVNDVPTKVNFVGSREKAEKVHNVHISLSHEDELGACVGWKASTSSDGAVFAVDVADVTAVAHTAAKYPQFRARWLPQVKLTNERQQGSSPLGGPPLRSWWRSGCGQCGDELIRASHAIILAQHWSVRECCVKLQGIGGKSFDYSCVVPLLNSPYPTESFRPQFLFPHTVYAGVITGEEAHVMQKRELGCGIRIETALDWVYSRKLKCKKPMVVTVASCDRSRLL